MLAFIQLVAISKDPTRCTRSIALWKNLYPSEGSEALPRTTSSDSLNSDNSTSDDAARVSNSSKWFAVYTTCRHEKRIAQHFNAREIKNYLPLYRAERRWRDGSRVTLDLPLFPSYIFVQIKTLDRVKVLSVPGTLAVVCGTGHEPAPLPEAAIEALRWGQENRTIAPHPLLTAGQQVRIRSGAFAGMEGVVVRKKSGLRVVLTLQQIMQSIAIEVDEGDLEPVGAPGPMPAQLPSSLAGTLCSRSCMLGLFN